MSAKRKRVVTVKIKSIAQKEMKTVGLRETNAVKLGVGKRVV